MNLRNYIDADRYKGIMAISDIHAEFHLFTAAAQYAMDSDLFIVILGDLVDGGRFPLETVQFAKVLLDQNRAVAINGNHDDKSYRWTLGNAVHLHSGNRATIADAAKWNIERFKRITQEVYTHPRTSFYWHYGKTIFAHGGVHPTLWTLPDTVSRRQKAFCLYAEVDGTTMDPDEPTLPARTYKWTNDIPADSQAVVGHDTKGLGKPKTEPAVFDLGANNRVFYTDTACGKGEPDSHLTGAVFIFVDNELSFVRYIPFK